MTDPFQSLVRQLKDPVRCLVQHGHLSAAVKLVYCGIDALAFLGLPANRDTVVRDDFIRWVDGNLRFPCKEQLPGIDAYGARCATLHTHGTDSTLSDLGKCRQVGYMSEARPEVASDEAASPGLVMVSVPALATAFYAGMDRFLVSLFADTSRAKAAEARLPLLITELALE